MAVEIHVAQIKQFKIDQVGNIINDNSATIKQMLNYETDHRIIEDTTISNTTGNPTIKSYLEQEASDGFQFEHLDQYYIITQKIT